MRGKSARNSKLVENLPSMSILHSAVAMLMVVFILQAVVQVATGANLPPSEITALHELYNSTQGHNWLWRPILPRWKFTPTANPCTGHWQGITCTLNAARTVYHVSRIALTKYRMVGELPASIGNFSHLKHLEVTDNYIIGKIPQTIGHLSNLTYISVGYNALSGGIPDTICELRSLTSLYLEDNPLGGTIPSCIGDLTYLRNLTILYNKMTGTIPTSLGNLTHLSVLVLSGNALTGTIPCALTKPVNLRALLLADNLLVGTVPSCLGDMVSLRYLYLSENSLNGTLPASLGDMSALLKLYVEINQLTGTIPASYSTLTGLTELGFNSNRLTGTLPDIFGDMPQLNKLGLYNNCFSGPIPASLSQLTLLQSVFLENNKLTGTLPVSLKSCVALTVIEVGFNQLTGTIPDMFDSLKLLSTLVLNDNGFTGLIPGSMYNLSLANEIGLETNYLTGIIEEAVGKLSVEAFYAGGNFLTGTLPGSLGNISKCQVLFLGENLLHGTVPVSLGGLRSLSELALSRNLLSGSILRSYVQLHDLITLLLGYNSFSGSLDGVFNASAQLRLASVQVNNNQLTGTIPGEVFRLPALKTFVALSNCFHGSIPEAACNASALSTLVLDGLSSSTSCRRELPSGAYLLSRSVGGTLPQCLFQLPSLTTLHLSGNTFHGSFPGVANVAGNLTDLSVSHNQLSGPIPTVYQLRAWSNFDASYNRLSGTLQSDFSATSTELNQSAVSLENNRLSGRIPGSLQQIQNVSVLGTNLFECNLAGSNLPQHDSDRDHYQCGSSSFDVPFYLWLGLATPVVAWVLWRYSFPLNKDSHLITLVRLLSSWYDNSQREESGGRILPDLMHVMDCIGEAGAYCAMYVTVVLLPCYVLLSHFYGTLTYSYAWVASAAYLSGAVPVAVELPLWLLMLVVAAYIVQRARSRQPTSLPDPGANQLSEGTAGHNNRAVVRTLFLIIDLVVVVGVNVLYVYIAIYQSSALLVLAQVMMSFFKLLWNGAGMDAILLALTKSLAPALLTGDGIENRYRSEFLTLQLFTSLLNSIAIPCLVVAGVSPNCFYNVFQAAPVVRAQYTVRGCDAILDGGSCLEYATVALATEYDAPFTYNYQCSSSLITYYAPAYINLCIIAAFISPVVSVLMVAALAHSPKDTAVHRLLSAIVPRILAPADPAHTTETLVNSSQLQVKLVTYLGVLLTFGTMLPPLGVALAVTITMVVAVVKLKIGRYLCSAEEQGQLEKFVRILEQQCNGAGSASFLQSALWMLVTLSCLFYTLFLFDTLGDAVGFRGALWVLAVVPLLPACAYLMHLVWRHWAQRAFRHRAAAGFVADVTSVELGPVVRVETMNALHSVSAPIS